CGRCASASLFWARGGLWYSSAAPTPPSAASVSGTYMGRIFDTRKHVMFARWDKMSKAFARIGKEITIAVKAAGPTPGNDPQLRGVIQNARAVNMPKDKVEAAIKRAQGVDASDYAEIIYEGYGPHGAAIVVEAATDNPTRTVANVRSAFN